VLALARKKESTRDSRSVDDFRSGLEVGFSLEETGAAVGASEAAHLTTLLGLNEEYSSWWTRNQRGNCRGALKLGLSTNTGNRSSRRRGANVGARLPETIAHRTVGCRYGGLRGRWSAAICVAVYRNVRPAVEAMPKGWRPAGGGAAHLFAKSPSARTETHLSQSCRTPLPDYCTLCLSDDLTHKHGTS
jgi:hypothetical protein